MIDEIKKLKTLNLATIIVETMFLFIIILYIALNLNYALHSATEPINKQTVDSNNNAYPTAIIITFVFQLISIILVIAISTTTSILIICKYENYGSKYSTKLLVCGILGFLFILIPNCIIDITFKKIITEIKNNTWESGKTNALNNNWTINNSSMNPENNLNEPNINCPSANNNCSLQIDDVYTRIEKMYQLKEKGIISEEDFEKFKNLNLGI